METPETIRAFWFGENSDDKIVSEQYSSLWWSKNSEIDAQIQTRFESLVLAAGNGELTSWLTSSTGRLALILLTDQFPRNIYRNQARAFAFDVFARNWCLDGLNCKVDQELRPIERVFFYLPLEHSENLNDQNLSVSLFGLLANEVAPQLKKTFEYFLDFAKRHQSIIERFGRFPHRNSILRRKSTPEEIKFLSEPNSSF